MKPMNSEPYRTKTPRFSRDELHRTYSGRLYDSDFSTGVPIFLADIASRIRGSARFDDSLHSPLTSGGGWKTD